MTTTAANLASVRVRIDAAAREAKRDPAAVHLIAVTKTFGPDDITPVLDAMSADGRGELLRALEEFASASGVPGDADLSTLAWAD